VPGEEATRANIVISDWVSNLRPTATSVNVNSFTSEVSCVIFMSGSHLYFDMNCIDNHNN